MEKAIILILTIYIVVLHLKVLFILVKTNELIENYDKTSRYYIDKCYEIATLKKDH